MSHFKIAVAAVSSLIGLAVWEHGAAFAHTNSTQSLVSEEEANPFETVFCKGTCVFSNTVHSCNVGEREITRSSVSGNGGYPPSEYIVAQCRKSLESNCNSRAAFCFESWSLQDFESSIRYIP